jgi:hypothetical protein
MRDCDSGCSGPRRHLKTPGEPGGAMTAPIGSVFRRLSAPSGTTGGAWPPGATKTIRGRPPAFGRRSRHDQNVRLNLGPAMTTFSGASLALSPLLAGHLAGRSRRCSSMIRGPLLSRPLAWRAAAPRRWSCPSRNDGMRCCRPGGAMTRAPRNCASRSSIIGRSGTVSKTSLVSHEGYLLASTALNTGPGVQA